MSLLLFPSVAGGIEVVRKLKPGRACKTYAVM